MKNIGCKSEDETTNSAKQRGQEDWGLWASFVKHPAKNWSQDQKSKSSNEANVTDINRGGTDVEKIVGGNRVMQGTTEYGGPLNKDWEFEDRIPDELQSQLKMIYH